MLCKATHTQPHVVYRLFDADDRLLYIGCTSHLDRRLRSLRSMERSRRWMTQVVKVDATTYPDRATAFAAEREAIRAEQPIRNVQGKAAA